MSHFSTNPHSHLGAANYSYIQQGFGTDNTSNEWSQLNGQSDVFTTTSSHEPPANARRQHDHEDSAQEPYHTKETSPSSLISNEANSAVERRSVPRADGNSVHTSFTTGSDHSQAIQKLHEPQHFERNRNWFSEGIASINYWWQGHKYANTWWWEITCCIIALGALLAIVATIRIHERKVLPQWRFGLTVNAIISAYTVILKAAAGLVLAEGISHLKWITVAQPQCLSTFVAHDDASRGPLGAFKLLFRNQYRSRRFHASPYISSLGALITILVLLLDPFSQQIIRTYECERQTIGEFPTISRTNVYTEVGAHSGAGEATIRIPLRNAVYNGIFASQKPPTSFSCRTGKCTFSDTYTSLAYCSSCTDVSEKLKFTEYEQFDKLLNRTFPYTNVSLPVGRQWLTLSRGGEAMTRGYIGLKSYYDTELNMIRWDGRSSIPDKNQMIRAYRCNIYPCTQTFRANVSTGLVKEEIVEESEAVFSSLVQPRNYTAVSSVADLDCLDTSEQRQQLKQLGYKFNETTRWLPYNISLSNGTTEKPVYAASYYSGTPCDPANQFPDLCNGNHTTEKANSIVPARCMYNIGLVTANSIRENLFKPMFSGEVRNSWTYGYPGYDGLEALTAVYNAGSGNGTLKELQDIMRGMTDTLTTYIRQSGEKGFSKPATGMMYDNTSCIQVRWAWLSYSAMVVGLLLTFFIWMTWYARSSQVQLQGQWASAHSKPNTHDFKSSASSLLFHGLDHETLRHMDDVGASNKEAEVEKRAEKLMVTLVATEQGWKLSGVGP